MQLRGIFKWTSGSIVTLSAQVTDRSNTTCHVLSYIKVYIDHVKGKVSSYRDNSVMMTVGFALLRSLVYVWAKSCVFFNEAIGEDIQSQILFYLAVKE